MKTIFAFFAFVIAITCLFVLDRSEAASAAEDKAAIRPFTVPSVPELLTQELRAAFKSLR